MSEPISPETIKNILRLRKEGYSRREISKRTNIGQTTVQKYSKAVKDVSKPDDIPKSNGEKVEVKFENNEGTIEAYSNRILTLEDLLAASKVDTLIWNVERYVVNKWEVGAAGPDKKIVVTPLFQVKANLVRKIALASTEIPPVQPIHIKSTKSSAIVKKIGSQIKRAIVIPDIQCGFKRDIQTGKLDPLHNRAAMDIVMQVIKESNPDRIIFCGDNLDLPDFSSKYLCSPEFKGSTQAAIVELGWYYGQARALAPNAIIDVIEGNHDKRFTTALISRMEVAYGLRPSNDLLGPDLISMERLLGLADLNITYHGPYPLGRVWINDNLNVHHGEVVRSGSGKTVAKMTEDLRSSEITGHLHREESASKTFWSKEGPKTYQAVSVGTLARIDIGIVPSAVSRNNWQNAFGNVFYEEGNGFYNVNGVLIFKDLTIFEGKRFEARLEKEIVAHIQSDTGYDLKAA